MKKTHGHSRSDNGRPTRTYRTWVNMKARCDNVLASNYEYYGGRGIGYCGRWKNFENFLEDMGEIPDNMTIERINGKEDYSPQNCRWATQAEQCQNKGDYVSNTSGTRGVSWDKGKALWRSYFSLQGRNIFLYTGPSLEEAVLARKKWELEHRG